MLHRRAVPIDGHSKSRFLGSFGYGYPFRCPDGCGHLLKTPFHCFSSFPASLRAESAMLLIYVFHGVGADSQFFGYLLICFFSQ